MKKLLSTVLLACAAFGAQAEIIAKAANESGGGIFLTNTKCSKGGLVMMARNPSGQTHFGCYVIQETLVVVRYDDGSTFTYEANDFTILGSDPSPQPSSARSVPNL